MKLFLTVLITVSSSLLAFGQKVAGDEIERGNQLIKAGNAGAAIEAFSKAIEADPTSAAAYLGRAELLARSQRCDLALPDFTKASEMDAANYKAVAGRAFCLGAAGRLDESIAEATRAIKLDPSKPAAYHTRGIGLYKSRRFDEALRDHDQAIELGLNSAEAYYQRGISRDITDDWLGAITDLTRAIELDPGNWKRYSGRAIARRSYGDYLGAVEDYNKLLELAPGETLQIHYRSWAKLFGGDAAGAYQDTLDYLGKQGPAHPGAPLPVVVGYIALRKMGKDDAARTLVREALKYAKAGEWQTSYLSFLSGNIGPEKLIELAGESELLLTDAHGLVGTKYLLDGDQKSAAVHFKWDQEHGSHERIMHQLARTEFARMNGDPRLLTPPRPIK